MNLEAMIIVIYMPRVQITGVEIPHSQKEMITGLDFEQLLRNRIAVLMFVLPFHMLMQLKGVF